MQIKERIKQKRKYAKHSSTQARQASQAREPSSRQEREAYE